jgi:hypothetical protein
VAVPIRLDLRLGLRRRRTRPLTALHRSIFDKGGVEPPFVFDPFDPM